MSHILKRITTIIIILIFLFALIFFFYNFTLPQAAIVPTYEYIAIENTTDKIELSLNIFINKLSAKPNDLILDIPGVEVEELEIEPSDSFFQYGLYSILAKCRLTKPVAVETTTVRVGFNGAEMISAFAGHIMVDYPVKTDNSVYLNPMYGVQSTIITDADEIEKLKNEGEQLEAVGDGSYILTKKSATAVCFSDNTKLPYSVTPLQDKIHLNKIQYGFQEYYTINETNQEEYIGKIPVNLTNTPFCFITPVIEYTCQNHIGREIGPKVILIDRTKTIKDLFFESIQIAEENQPAIV